MTHATEIPAALVGCLEACERCAQVVAAADSATDASAFAACMPKESSVGMHLRHCIEHVQCFLDGLPDGRVNYDGRQRDARLETDAAYFLAELERIAEALSALIDADLGCALTVVQTASASGATVAVNSTVERELVFLSGHTIHHLALIDHILRAQGISVDRGMSVAFSTAAFQRSSSCQRSTS